MTQNPYLNREVQALAEAGHTAIRPALAWVLSLVFLGLIYSVPLIQVAHDLSASERERRGTSWPQVFDLFRRAPAAVSSLPDGEMSLPRRILRANRAVLREMHAYEDGLENDSLTGKWLRPWIQYSLLRWTGAGNEKVYAGYRPWLFYRPEIEYLVGAPFLDPKQQSRRVSGASEWDAAPQPDPVKAILDFHRQLALRGIVLIVMPTPCKAMIHPEKFARACADRPLPLQNPSYERFVRQLESAGVAVFDVSRELAKAARSTGQPQFLAMDTHWRPEAMQSAARSMAEFIRQRAPLDDRNGDLYKTQPLDVTQAGDIAVMLRLPKNQSAYPRETAHIRQVISADDELWRPLPSADVLVLGDSYCNIYSLESMGWGESAGFVEQLAYELQRPLDRITFNDNGAYAGRAWLSREIGRGRDRLAGKRLVIWQFAVRELAEGDWKLIDLPPSRPRQ